MSYIKGDYISDEGLKSIRGYKYQPGEYSTLDKILTPFWNFVVTLFPKSVAPNTITLLGVFIVSACYSSMLYYDMSMTKPLPEWTYLLSGFGIFVFQTFDAIDGKQARRTDSSSPLGQLFDHGCDAITWTVTSLSVVSFLQLGLTNDAILAMFATTSPFYLTNLLEYYSGVYEYNIAHVDGTTGQWLLIMCNLFPFIYGNNFYDRPVGEILFFLPNILTDGFICRDYAMIILAYVGVIYSIVLIVYLLKSASGIKNIFIVSMQMLQMFGVFFIMAAFDETIPFINENAGWVYVEITLLYSIITTKLIVCLMSKMYYSFIHFEYLVFGIYFYFQYNYQPNSAEHDMQIKYAFWVTFAIYLFLYLRLVQTCINQIAENLGIYCFSLQKRKQKDN